MEPAGAFDLFQFFADFRDAFADQSPIRFDLCFAGAAEKAEAAALTFQVGPAFDETAALIGQMSQLDLQAAFPRLRALPENLENQRGAIEHLRVPRLFQIALLHRAQIGVDDDHFGFEFPRICGDLVHLAAADQCCRNGPRQRYDQLRDDLQADGRGEAHAFGKPRFRIAIIAIVRAAALGLHVNDEGGTCAGVTVGLLQI